jgi:outer membrane protein assembly factor BamB
VDALWLAMAVSGVVCLLVGRVMPGAGSVSNLRGAVATVCVVLAVALTALRVNGSGTMAAPVRPTQDRLWRGLAAGMGLAGAGLAVWILGSGVGGGLLDPAVGVFTVGALAAAAGVVGAASRAVRSRPGPVLGRPSRWLRWSTVAAAVAVAVAVGVVATVTSLVVGRVGVDASTASVTAIPAVPQMPGAGRWTWQPPGRVVGVVRAGPGVVAATAGGRLTALDGRTGQPRWHYGLAGTEVQGLAASPDGTTVLAVYARRVVTSDGEPQRLVVLDAVTGVLRWQQRLGTGDTFRAGLWNLSPTNRTLPILRPRPGLILGYDLASGARRWTWTLPPNCEALSVNEVVGGTDTVMMRAHCQAGRMMQITLFGLDERSGVLRWQRIVASGEGHLPEGYPVVSSDGQEMTLPGTKYVLDERTGRPVVSLQANEEAILDIGSLPVGLDDAVLVPISTIQVLQPDGRRIPIDVRMSQYRPWLGSFVGSRFTGRVDVGGSVGPLSRLYGVATTDRTLLVACLDTNGAPAVAVHDLPTHTATPRVISLSGLWTPVREAPRGVGSEAIAVLPAPGALVLARLSPNPGQTAQPVIGLT